MSKRIFAQPIQIDGELLIKDITSVVELAAYGQIYTKADNRLYYYKNSIENKVLTDAQVTGNDGILIDLNSNLVIDDSYIIDLINANSSNLIAGTNISIAGSPEEISVVDNPSFSGIVTITNTTNSTDKDTGALVVNGGVGIENDVYIGGSLNVLTNATVSGDFTVLGTTTTINTTELLVEDNIIEINSGQTGTPLPGLISGLRVNRGVLNPYVFIFDESTDTFRIGITADIGSPNEFDPTQLQAVATRQDTPIVNGVAVWNNTAARFDTYSQFTFDLVGSPNDPTITLGSETITPTQIQAWDSAGAFTAGNGLTLSTGVFKLGGTLTENTSIVDDTNNRSLYLGDNGGNTTTFGLVSITSLSTELYNSGNYFKLNNTGLDIRLISDSSGNTFNVEAGGTGTNGLISVYAINAANTLSNSFSMSNLSTRFDHYMGEFRIEMGVNSTDARFIDNRTITKGIEYDADYSAGYTNRSLVDKEYVDNKITTAGLQPDDVIAGDGISIEQSGTPASIITINNTQATVIPMIVTGGTTNINLAADTNNVVIIDYYLTQNSQFQEGQVRILKTGASTVQFTHDFQNTAPTQVTFAADINTGNIRLNLTNAGTNGTIKYIIRTIA